jgi:hypothetical protein
MPQFAQATFPAGVRWFRYQAPWDLDTAMETTAGQLWVTYWPKSSTSHPPEYFGQLYGGVIRHYVLPKEPYYFLKLDNYTGAFPIVDGYPYDPWVHLRWAVLPNGSLINASNLPRNQLGSDRPILCKQGSPQGAVALYGLLPSGQWQPLLTWRVWQAATMGIWQYSPNYPLECAGRFNGRFLVWYDTAGQGAIFVVHQGKAEPFTSGRPYLITDKTMLLAGGPGQDWIIEAHAP